MKVTLISTVLNCVDRVDPFLASLAGQIRAPDEVIIVDGGSTDGTADRFRADDRVTVIDAPGGEHLRGQELALAHATHDVIAATDADCELDPGWLAAIVAPIEAGADVSAGFYEPIRRGFLQACVAGLNLPLDAWRSTRRRSCRARDRWRSAATPSRPRAATRSGSISARTCG